MSSSAPAPSPTPDPPDEGVLSPSAFPPLVSFTPSQTSIPPTIPAKGAPSYAQRFKSSLRNLRKISSPTFEEDGTPVVQAPPSVILNASESWKDHILCKFHGRMPISGKVFSDLNPIWGKKGDIIVRTVSSTACLIYVPSVQLREWILEVGYWQVANCALSVYLWNPDASLEAEDLVSAPTWAVLKKVPPQLYSLDGISVIASGIGEPLHTEKSRLDPFHFGDTKVKVEISLDAPPPSAVIVRDSLGYSVKIDVSQVLVKDPEVQLEGSEVVGQVTEEVVAQVSEVVGQVTEGSEVVAQVSEDVGQEIEDGEIVVQEVVVAPCLPPPVGSSFETLVQGKKALSKGSTQKVRVISHRSDASKTLTLPLNPGSSLTVDDEPSVEGVGLSPPDPEAERPFLPSPAAARKARKDLRRQALLNCSSPTAAASQLFSSIRGLSSGGRRNRF
ncbi:uncharacterized protein LOC130503829 [Raphanus sativus]|uniref:Uncharacterized protein LOC130503829 n=1 Tax=Raphanus sativus TaxID=3726 RepID=A0A9W3CS66_RAPSA|nr:uncharacterized protein LOC130503829 [Raphanus sativus]